MAKKDKKIGVFLENYKNSMGNVSVACEKTGISRMTFYNWKESDKDFAQKVEEIDEASVDLAEEMLRAKVKEGDMTAIIFTLKCKGKNRGYVEKKEIEANVNTFEQFMRGLPDNPENLDRM